MRRPKLEVVAMIFLVELLLVTSLRAGEAQENGSLPFEQVVRQAFPDRSSASLDGGIQFLSHDRAVRAPFRVKVEATEIGADLSPLDANTPATISLPARSSSLRPQRPASCHNVRPQVPKTVRSHFDQRRKLQRTCGFGCRP